MAPEMRSRRRASLRPRKPSTEEKKPAYRKKKAVYKKKIIKKNVPDNVKNMNKEIPYKMHIPNNFTQTNLNAYNIFQPSVLTQTVVPHSGSTSFGWVDDDHGHLNFNMGDVLIERYQLIGFLGRGTFGRVAKAYDFRTQQCVALKIVRNEEVCRESGKGEINIMKKLRVLDPFDTYHWVRMVDYFEFWGHVFIVFELLGNDLYTFMKDVEKPYLISPLRHIAYQIILAVGGLHKNSLVHTDLKPENICFTHLNDMRASFSLRQRRRLRFVENSAIRLIDFGSAMHNCDPYRGLIQTRHYRAPEVILGMHWSYPCDVWSIGCILFELYTGFCLFLVDNDKDHIGLMEEVLGPLPPLFTNTVLGRSLSNPPGKKIRKNWKPLRKHIKSSAAEHIHFFRLLEACLEFDPKDRIALDVALNHPFFNALPDYQKS